MRGNIARLAVVIQRDVKKCGNILGFYVRLGLAAGLGSDIGQDRNILRLDVVLDVDLESGIEKCGNITLGLGIRLRRAGVFGLAITRTWRLEAEENPSTLRGGSSNVFTRIFFLSF